MSFYDRNSQVADIKWDRLTFLWKFLDDFVIFSNFLHIDVIATFLFSKKLSLGQRTAEYKKGPQNGNLK